MLIPFGILSAAGISGFSSDYELISTTVLGSTTASVTFSSLGDYASTYKHLQIRAVVRGSQAAGGVNTRLQINADTGTTYSEHGVFGNGTTISVYATASTTGMFFGNIPGSTATANAFAAVVIDLLDAYSTTKNKTIRNKSGFSSVGNNRVDIGSGARRNIESTTSMTLIPQSGSWAANSRFSLYGIRG
jgi:hypothetical protein